MQQQAPLLKFTWISCKVKEMTLSQLSFCSMACMTILTTYLPLWSCLWGFLIKLFQIFKAPLGGQCRRSGRQICECEILRYYLKWATEMVHHFIQKSLHKLSTYIIYEHFFFIIQVDIFFSKQTSSILTRMTEGFVIPCHIICSNFHLTFDYRFTCSTGGPSTN